MSVAGRLARGRGAGPAGKLPRVPEQGAETAAGLLARYRPGRDAFWSSRRGTLLAEDAAAHVRSPWSPDLADEVRDLLTGRDAVGHERPLVVGALPFRTADPVALVVPRVVHRARGRLHLPEDGTPPSTAAPAREHAVPHGDVYRAAVREALGLLGTGALEKVVLARALDVRASAPVDVPRLLARLAAHDEEARVFAVDLPRAAHAAHAGRPVEPVGPVRTLVGASPELLVSLRDGEVLATPLAGSAGRHPDPVVDAARARALLGSDKDRREHALVVDAMVKALTPWCDDLVVPPEPSLVATPTVWHLSTRLTGWTADPRTTSLHLARALHPTPAVGGTPVEAALAAIDRLEPVDRGYYAGATGWCDAVGNGEWAVSIRCGVVEDDAVRLHAGAGIVRGSDPDAELAETSAKLEMLRSAIP